MAFVKGDVRLGDYTLRMDFNALCEAEDDFPGIMRVKSTSRRSARSERSSATPCLRTTPI